MVAFFIFQHNNLAVAIHNNLDSARNVHDAVLITSDDALGSVPTQSFARFFLPVPPSIASSGARHHIYRGRILP